MELELNSIYSQINPHFIFNTLNSGLHFIKKGRTTDAYDHIYKFSKLLRAYLASARNRYITLDAEIENLKNYIELQQTRFSHVFDYNIEVHHIDNMKSIRIPSLLLQPIVENAINHGLLPMDGKGYLHLSFVRKEDNVVECTIADNDIGRKRSKQLKTGEPERESVGEKLLDELVTLFNEYEHMGIDISYHDKEEPLTGTIVIVKIKNPGGK